MHRSIYPQFLGVLRTQRKEKSVDGLTGSQTHDDGRIWHVEIVEKVVQTVPTLIVFAFWQKTTEVNRIQSGVLVCVGAKGNLLSCLNQMLGKS